jgi:hypothetical protein
MAIALMRQRSVRMNADQYLLSLVRQETVDTGPSSPVRGVIGVLRPALLKWGNNYLAGNTSAENRCWIVTRFKKMRSVAKISQPYRSKLFGEVAKNIPHNKRRLREPIGTEIPTGVTPETGVASA